MSSDLTANRRSRLENLMSGSANANIATCGNCGSTYFYSVTAEQFAKGNHHTVEYTSISNNPKSVKICVCGTPLPPSKTGPRGASAVRQVQQDFQDSMDKACAYISNNKPTEIVKHVASIKEVEELRAKIDALVKELHELKAHKEPKPKDK